MGCGLFPSRNSSCRVSSGRLAARAQGCRLDHTPVRRPVISNLCRKLHRLSTIFDKVCDKERESEDAAVKAASAPPDSSSGLPRELARRAESFSPSRSAARTELPSEQPPRRRRAGPTRPAYKKSGRRGPSTREAWRPGCPSRRATKEPRETAGQSTRCALESIASSIRSPPHRCVPQTSSDAHYDRESASV